MHATHPVHAHVEVLERADKVFTESEFKPNHFLRFIHDPMHALHEGDWGVETPKDRYSQCGSILAPRSVKKVIDNLFQNIIGNSVELNFKLDKTYGNMLTDVIYKLCDEEKCLDFCRCKYLGKPRMWSHIIYHKVLKECAKVKGIDKEDFIEFVKDFNVYSVLGKYDRYDRPNEENREIDETTALDFILASFFRQKGHFEELHIEMERYDRFDENLFKNCKNNKCDYNYKEKIVWESKSKIEASADTSSINQRSPFTIIKNRDYKPKKRMIPRSRILSVSCKCSDERARYELRNYSSKNIQTTISKGEDLHVIFHKYFNAVLPETQAKTAGKMMAKRAEYNENVPAFTDPERQTKIQLKKKIKKMKKLLEYLPDIESLSK